MARELWRPEDAGPPVLWLVRHGQSQGNVIRDAADLDGRRRAPRPVRDADVELTALGVQQAEAFGRWLANQALQPDAVLASPFERAVATAREICRHSPALSGKAVPTDERLRDREMGILDELTWVGIQEEFPNEAARAVRDGFFYYRPPGGESWADICLRLRSVLRDLARSNAQGVLLVAHDIVVQLTVALLTGLDERGTVELVRGTTFANCGLALLRRSEQDYEVLAYNTTAPVQQQGTPATQEADPRDVLG
jgi:2,3-bisphosphoglycerate-dependent phosphoglycerate mutase